MVRLNFKFTARYPLQVKFHVVTFCQDRAVRLVEIADHVRPHRGAITMLSDVRLDGDDIYWLEGRPQEQGRNVIVRAGRTALPPTSRQRHSMSAPACTNTVAARGSCGTAPSSFPISPISACTARRRPV